jgi:DNA mismatch repair protein MutS
MQDTECSLTPLGPATFDSASGERRLNDLFQVLTLEAFANFERVEIAALGAIVDYLDVTQKGKLPLLQPPIQQSTSQIMQIDAATRRNLEITQALSGSRKGSLLSTIDRTVTAAGARLLEQRISSPSLDTDEICNRLNAIDQMIVNSTLRDTLRDALRRVPDLERALSRISLDRAGPRDLC